MLSDLDLDGDGLKDLVIGDWHANNFLGEVRAYSHAGQLLYTLTGDVSAAANPPLYIANQFAKLGDVNDDGCDDYVMGCWDAPLVRGCGVVVSGATGAYLRICYGELAGDGIGIVVSECGDLDADGYCDFVAGSGDAFTVRGVARAFSSRTGSALHQWTYQYHGYSTSLASRGVDLDGDGLGDILISNPAIYFPSGPQGGIEVFSGRNGALLNSITRQPSQAGIGGNIAYSNTLLRPPVGSHIGLIVVPNRDTLPATTGACGGDTGAIVAYHGLPRTAVEIGASCPGNLPNVPNIGMSSLGLPGVRVHLSNAPPNSLAVLLLGLSTTQFYGVPLPAALDHLGLPGCSLRTSIEWMNTAVTGTTTAGNDSGHASTDLPFPVPATGNGTWSLSVQWLVLGDASTFPGGMSQAITWRR